MLDRPIPRFPLRRERTGASAPVRAVRGLYAKSSSANSQTVRGSGGAHVGCSGRSGCGSELRGSQESGTMPQLSHKERS